ncbi:MAG TPA: response regulator [Phycisphaerales bacterium]|nr:response regulator [Phycisphaerales bacterium]
MDQSRKILVADDDERLRRLLKIRLEAEGYTVILCQDAYQALEAARSQRPDLLLLDINMPAGSGFSVQERIAKMPELRNTPVIYITGSTSSETDQQAHDVGAYAIIHKPFSPARLFELIRTALGYWSCDDVPAQSA